MEVHTVKKEILKISIICVLVLALLIISSLLFPSVFEDKILYEKYRYPDEDFYGKDLYSEIIYDCSEYESEIGNMIVDRAFEVASYTGTEQDSETEMGDVGALSRFYYFHYNHVVSQKVDFQFINCKISGSEGHVWVVYTHVGYDDSGSRATSSSNILSLWYIEKQGEEWNVVRIMEAP